MHDKMMFPKKTWGTKKSKTMKAVCSEAKLQVATNELLAWRKVPYLRFSDGFLSWMSTKAPMHIKKHFFAQVGGKMPDNLLMYPLGSGLFLAAKLELKTEDKKGCEVGQLHGKQKVYAKKEGWLIARNIKKVETILNKLEELSEKVKTFIGGFE